MLGPAGYHPVFDTLWSDRAHGDFNCTKYSLAHKTLNHWTIDVENIPHSHTRLPNTPLAKAFSSYLVLITKLLAGPPHQACHGQVHNDTDGQQDQAEQAKQGWLLDLLVVPFSFLLWHSSVTWPEPLQVQNMKMIQKKTKTTMTMPVTRHILNTMPIS
jgi:hypothetical protein